MPSPFHPQPIRDGKALIWAVVSGSDIVAASTRKADLVPICRQFEDGRIVRVEAAVPVNRTERLVSVRRPSSRPS